MTTEKSRSPSSSAQASSPSARIASRSSAVSSSTLSSAPETSGQSKPTFAAFCCTFWLRINAGNALLTLCSTSVCVFCAFVFFLIASQLVSTSSVPSTVTEPNTCGWRSTIFFASPSTTSEKSNRPSSSSISEWKSTCNRTSPSSSCNRTGSSVSMASTAS